jgi:hypothetical protein
MSYKYTVLKDNPIAFYELDETSSGNVGTYTGLKAKFSTYQDLKDNGISYSAISGLPVYDFSGNFNDGFSLNASEKKIMPLHHGGERGTEVLPETIVYYAVEGIASKEYADNTFSLDGWFLITEQSESRVTLLGDALNNIGLFYENGNIIFAVGDYEVESTYPLNETIYVSGVFNPNKISLYINSNLQDSLSLTNYRFTNDSVSFRSGSSDIRFMIDGIAFYKSELSRSQILKHYNAGSKSVSASQIVYPDQGKLFSMNIDRMRHTFSYSYPESKKWSALSNENVLLSQDQSYLYFEKTTDVQSKEFTFTDYVIVPNYLGLESSQVYWDTETAGILVEVSIDNTVWESCTNGKAIPFFNKNEQQFEDVLYIRVTMSSEDTSRYLPVLRSLQFLFFTDKSFYGDNSSYTISSDYEYCLPKTNSRVLSYNKNNGLRMHDGHGFGIDSDMNIMSVEMFFTPGSGSCVLLSTDNESLSWDSSGLISKVGIDSIYVNGVDVSSSTNINDFFAEGLQHHMVIILNESASTDMRINESQDGLSWGTGTMYNNLAIYDYQLTQAIVDSHYAQYLGQGLISVQDTSLSLAEKNTGTDNLPFFLLTRNLTATNI